MLVALGLVAILALLGLVVDGGNLYRVRQKAQTAADASALAAAAAIPLGVDRMNQDAATLASLNEPPGSGVTTEVHWPYSGDSERVEIVNTTFFQPLFLSVVGRKSIRITNRAVARCRRNDYLVTGAMYADFIELAGNGLQVDSYNSAAGPYGAANSGEHAQLIAKSDVSLVNVVDQAVVGGDVFAGLLFKQGSATGGPFKLPLVAGSSRVTGSVTCGVASTLLTGARVDGDFKSNGIALNLGGSVGGSTQSFAHQTLPAITLPDIDFGPPSRANDNAHASPQTYFSAGSPPDVTMSAPNSTLNLSAGTYYFNNLQITGDHSAINVTSGPVTIYVKNEVFINATSTVNNATQDPKQLLVLVGGGDIANLNVWNAVTEFHGAIYAPRSSINLFGAGDFYGNIIAGQTLTCALTGRFHQDAGLAERAVLRLTE